MSASNDGLRSAFIMVVALGVAAIALALSACSAGQSGGGVTGSADVGSSPAVEPAPTPVPSDGIPDGSILRFEKAGDASQLVADMAAGMVPVECDVLYDAMGTRPAVTVDDPELIARIYELLSQVTVDGPSNTSITDSYHHVTFTLQDGATIGYSFEGEELLSLDRENFAVSGAGPLWSLVRQLQDEVIDEQD